MGDRIGVVLVTYASRLPEVLAWVVGIVLCFRFHRRTPKAAMFTLVALVLLVLESFIHHYRLTTLSQDLQRVPRSQMGFAFALDGFFGSVLNAVSWVLLLLAVFGSSAPKTDISDHVPAGAENESGTNGALSRRPVSVTVLGWLLIAFAFAGLLLVGFFPVGLLDLTGFATILFALGFSCLIQLVVGLGLLLGKPWSRTFFLWVVPLSIATGFLNPNTILLVRIVLYGVGFVLLRQKAAKAFFRVASPMKAQVTGLSL